MYVCMYIHARVCVTTDVTFNGHTVRVDQHHELASSLETGAIAMHSVTTAEKG